MVFARGPIHRRLSADSISLLTFTNLHNMTFRLLKLLIRNDIPGPPFFVGT